MDVEQRYEAADSAMETNPSGLSVIVVTAIITLFATLAITLRIYGCLFILRRRLYFEEWLSVINQIDLWLTAAFAIHWIVNTAAGTHWNTLTDAEKTRAVLWFNVYTIPAVLSLGLPKLAVVSLLCRIFKPTQVHKIILWTAAVLCVVSFVAIIFLAWLPCRPVAAGWDVTITEKTCLDPWVYVRCSYYAAVFSTALDVYLALYPAFAFRNLGWNRKKKMILSFIMGLGIFASGAACYKITFLEILSRTDDFTFDAPSVITWTVVEANVVMIAACVPALHPVYDKVVKWTTGNRSIDCESGSPPEQALSGPKQGFWSVVIKHLSVKSGTTLNTVTDYSRSAVSAATQSRGNWRSGNTDETRVNTTSLTVPMRSLEDAAGIQFPPDAIWTPRVSSAQGFRRPGPA